MPRLPLPLAFAAMSAVLLGAARAQDSVSLTPCLPGDAVSPWDDQSAANGSEQRNNYVVDLVPLATSWGNQFGIAPLAKASKIDSTFFTALIDAQAISRRQLSNQPISGTYEVWNTAGAGINNDSTINSAGSQLSNLPNGMQFAVSFDEYGQTGIPNISHNGLITSVVHYDPTNPSRMYVERVVAATAGCANDSSLASFGFGAVDATGTAALRADGFGAGGSCPGLNPLQADNLYLINASLRDGNILNVVNAAFPIGFDAPTTKWLVRESPTTHNTASVTGLNGQSFLVGSNFNDEFVRGTDNSNLVSNNAHFGPSTTSQRGGVSCLTQNHPAFNSTNGLCAILGVDSGGTTDILNVWGLDASGNPSTAMSLIPPATITDPIGNQTNAPGANEFDHYHSQVAFRGGNGQISMNIDAAGNLLVAAVMDQPSNGGSSWGMHLIPVARVSPAGTVSWTMAAYNTSASGTAQPILDGPGGTAIGQLSDLGTVTGGSVAGPSFSAPMIDSAGNVWFLSAIELFGNPSRFTTGLIRAVYDPVRFGYELELVFANGDVITGANSNTKYQIQFLPIADSNSISSGTAWSQNISESGYAGEEHPYAPTADPIQLGGLTIHAEIVYDADNDGDYEPCTGTTGNPNSGDQDYEVALYLAPTSTECQLDLGQGGPGNSHLLVCGDGLRFGQTSTIRLRGAQPSVPGALSISLAGFPDLSLFGGTLVSFVGNAAVVNIATDANGEFNLPVNGTANTASLVMQAVTLDANQPMGLGFSNAVLTEFGQ